jgi:hypothetical protein
MLDVAFCIIGRADTGKYCIFSGVKDKMMDITNEPVGI